MGSCKEGEKEKFLVYVQGLGSFLSSLTLSASLAWSCGDWRVVLCTKATVRKGTRAWRWDKKLDMN